jgi:drug/metabolite transporter (DMT)-like permease
MWSTSGLFAKAPWFEGWPEDARGALLAFFRSLFAMVLLAPLIRRPTFRWQMVPMTLCFAIMVWTFMSAMVYGPAANAIWLQYMSPAWVLLGSVLFLGEGVSTAEKRMFAFCFSGVLLIVVMELIGDGNPLATALALLSGVAFAGVVLSMRSMPEVDSVWLITLNHGGTVLILLPWVWTSHVTIAAGSYVALAAFGVFQMSVPYLFFARGLRQISSAEASMMILIEPILVPVWVFVAWNHHPSYTPPPWWTYVGATLILIGLVQRYLPSVVRRLRRQRSGRE